MVRGALETVIVLSTKVAAFMDAVAGAWAVSVTEPAFLMETELPVLTLQSHRSLPVDSGHIRLT